MIFALILLASMFGVIISIAHIRQWNKSKKRKVQNWERMKKGGGDETVNEHLVDD